MSLDVWFVVDRSTNPPRTGRITAENGSHTTVEWRDGSIETLPKRGSRQLRGRSDSVLGRFAQSPDDFTQRFLADPLPVFVAALRDGARRDAQPGSGPGTKRTFKAQDLQLAITPFGPTEEEAKSAWKQVQPSIKDLADVVVVKGAYRWIGEIEPVVRRSSEDQPAEASEPSAATERGTTEPQRTRIPDAAEPRQDQPVTSETPLPEATSTESVKGDTAADKAKEDTPTDINLLELLIRLTNKPNKVEAASIREQIESEQSRLVTGNERVLAWALGLREGQAAVTGSELAALPESALKVIAHKCEVENAQLITDVIDIRRDSKAARASLNSIDPDKRSLLFSLLLKRWREELEQVQQAKVRELIDGVMPVARRFDQLVTKLDQECRVAALKLSVALRVQGNLGTDLARIVERSLYGTRTTVEQLRAAIDASEIPSRRVFAALGAEDLTPSGYRVAVLAAIASRESANELQDPRAWTGLKVDSLAAIIESVPRLAEVVLRGGSDSIAAKKISDWSKVASDASVVGAVLEWPPAMLRLVSPSTFQQRLRGARRAHPDLDRLFNDELEAQRVAEIEERAKQLAIESETSGQRLAEAVGRVDTLTRELDGTRSRMREMQNSSTNALTSQLRQARIDTVKTLCRILDDVFIAGSSIGPGGDAIWERAVASANASGIVPIGRLNQAVEFNAEEYEPEDFGASFSAGQSTVVTRPGYKWIDVNDKIVISRALVVLGAATD